MSVLSLVVVVNFILEEVLVALLAAALVWLVALELLTFDLWAAATFTPAAFAPAFGAALRSSAGLPSVTRSETLSRARAVSTAGVGDAFNFLKGGILFAFLASFDIFHLQIGDRIVKQLQMQLQTIIDIFRLELASCCAMFRNHAVHIE